ncbi:EthD family reductase [Nocardia tengchongensis]|uniref:EthD family reductase n=1 Tax=Nocardia tengchongensis TaxID=2055889 RepID=A0ABX8CL32_9NOCA|nr:EthD family reductase [Nocardia tengchongensis]QVI19629.1 EthD family reductase [Nocardia tengchongensis]
MHRLLVLYPKPADPDHFREYYVTKHLPLVREMPGLLAYRYSFDVAATKGEAPYFAVFEADFADATALAAARSSAQGQRAAADVVNYATGGAVVIDYPVQDGIG